MVNEHKGLFVLTVVAVLIVVSVGFYYFNESTGMVIGTGQAVGNPTFQLFYGFVTSNGVVADDGVVVEAVIQEGGISETTIVSGGAYSLILEGGNDGDTVVFSVDGEGAGTIDYREYDSTELNLAVGVGDNDAESLGGSPRRSPSGSVTCTEDWECGEWSDCSRNVQTRTCVDKNNCRTRVTQPEISRDCSSLGSRPDGAERPDPTVTPKDDFDTLFYVIVVFILLIILVIMFYWILKSLKKKNKGEKDLLKKMEKPVIKKEKSGIPLTSPEVEGGVRAVAKAVVKKNINVPKNPTKEFFMTDSKS